MTRANDFDAVLRARFSRRATLQGLAGAAGLAAFGPRAAARCGDDVASPSTLTFREVPHGTDGHMHVPDGYRAEVLLAWGDPVLADAPSFRPLAQTAAAQERQFGANADWVAWLSLPLGAGSSEHGLLCVNHEFTNLHMSAPGLTRQNARERATRAQCEVEMAAVGLSVVEARKRENRWHVVQGGELNRRITATTPTIVSGPAAGHARLRTKADPTGRNVVGTFNNCAGGVTPWGTILTCEENFNWHFGGATEDALEAPNHERYLVGGEVVYGWYRHFDRFDVSKEPREANRFGWVVEIDPYDPEAAPVKRTALGRAKHESATCCVAPDGRVVVYSGDDDEFEHLYRFVTNRPWDPADRAANRDLLDDGVLEVARFEEDGTLRWLPLVHGEGELVEENGFGSQADVVIEARRAADLVGATRMDRPEDIEPHPGDGRVFVMLTKNKLRETADEANPRTPNPHGHVLELLPPASEDGPDHAARTFTWSVFLLAGDPRDDAEGAVGARYHPDTSRDGWFSCPDNAACDPRGRLWITTDGAPKASGFADGVWACDTEGPGRALTRRFFRGPRGAEVCGPCFTPDARTFFVTVQHPGDGDDRGNTREASFDSPTCRFPDQDEDIPPRAALIAIVRADGGEIGT